MHPNPYLRTFWRANFRPEIFVAMSFSGTYEERFDKIIRPAIESIQHRSRQLKANRVDLSRSGDSILTEISDGIAHAEMVLADVSTLGYDAKTGNAYRNGNVMYEVGLALACRQPTEVLLIRDDHDKFLFDVSTIPHKQMNFADEASARTELANELVARLREINHMNDARLLLATSTLTAPERGIIEAFKDYTPEKVFWLQKGNLATLAAIPRLLDKQLLITAGTTNDGKEMFRWTRLGYTLAQSLETLLPKHDATTSEETDTQDPVESTNSENAG